MTKQDVDNQKQGIAERRQQILQEEMQLRAARDEVKENLLQYDSLIKQRESLDRDIAACVGIRNELDRQEQNIPKAEKPVDDKKARSAQRRVAGKPVKKIEAKKGDDKTAEA